MKPISPVDGKSQLQRLCRVFGSNRVFLRVAKGKKKPIDKDWPKFSLESTQAASYISALEQHIAAGGNLGIALGAVSGDLYAIDFDTEAALAAFLELNPRLNSTLCTRANRGAQLWVHIEGERPRQVHKLFVDEDSPLVAGVAPEDIKDGKAQVGEWRGDRGQSVILGTHSAGPKYQITNQVEILSIRFDEIKWPADIELPWLEKPEPAPLAQEPLTESLDDRIRAYMPELCKRFYPEGIKEGDNWRVAAPEGGRGQSCCFTLGGEHAGTWHEFNGEASGFFTDALAKKRGSTLKEARAEIERFFDRNKSKLLFAALKKAAVSGQVFRELKLIPRRRLLGEWFREGDTGFIFSFRGVGKTWLAYGIARAISRGETFEVWEKGETALPVGYLDGEMPAELMQERDKAFGEPSENLTLINHEILFDRTGVVLNLADQNIQKAVTRLCLDKGLKVLVIDNLSTLVSGVKENDADAWEALLPWLLHLRRMKIATVIVHHAGRSGEMRGTSRREDSVFWIIKLERQEDYVEPGCSFLARFEKNRNCAQDPDSLIWTFKPDAFSGKVTITTKRASLKDLVLDLILDGLSSCNVIAKELNCSTGSVSNVAKQLAAEGKIEIDKRRYRPTENSQSPLDSALHEQAEKMRERE